MTRQLPPSLERLAAVNPAIPDDLAGRDPEAQVILQQILEDSAPPAPTPARQARRWTSRRLMLLMLPVVLVGAGGAVAATDPFGWFASPNPDTAIYELNPAHRVRTPTVTSIRCEPAIEGAFRCGARLHGRPYGLIDKIQPPGKRLTRALVLRSIDQAVASGKLTPHKAQMVRRDLARVSDRFIANIFGGAGTGEYQGGPDATANGVQLVPPPGVPSFIACRNDGAVLRCENLNGNASVPVGSGVYLAEATSDWRPAPPRQHEHIPPPQLTAAEYQFLKDLFSFAVTSGSSGN